MPKLIFFILSLAMTRSERAEYDKTASEGFGGLWSMLSTRESILVIAQARIALVVSIANLLGHVLIYLLKN